MSSGALQIERAGSVWHMTLARPQQGNALSSELVHDLDEAMVQAERAAVAAVVLKGAGRHFCTGFDLSHLEDETDDSLLARFVRIELLLQRVARAPFLTIAVASGRSLGAGADLFTACDVRLVDMDATFSFPGALGFGLVLGTRRLSARVGASTASEWVRHSVSINTRTALDAGLVSAVAAGAGSLAITLQRHLEIDAATGVRLRAAMEPMAALDDARDLEHLVRSAAQPGLRNRIAAYVQRMAWLSRVS